MKEKVAEATIREYKAQGERVLVESPMAKPANHDPSPGIVWDPDPDPEEPVQEPVPIAPGSDPASAPDTDPSPFVVVDGVVVVILVGDDSLEDF